MAELASSPIGTTKVREQIVNLTVCVSHEYEPQTPPNYAILACCESVAKVSGVTGGSAPPRSPNGSSQPRSLADWKFDVLPSG